MNLFPDLDGLSRHVNWGTRVQVEKRKHAPNRALERPGRDGASYSEASLAVGGSTRRVSSSMIADKNGYSRQLSAAVQAALNSTIK